MHERYDVVVVGAGSAGCVVARRLSQDPACRVLLLEAGPDPGPAETHDIRHPYPLSAYDAGWQWPGLTGQIVAGEDQRTARVPQGRLVGGSSSINAMVAMRGVAADFDEWRDAGAVGWGWRDVEPYFRRLESVPPTQHCDDMGAVAVARQPGSASRRLSNALLQAWGAAGFASVADPNTDFRDGCFVQPVSADAGGRCSANRAYLGPGTRARRNLRILSGAVCTRVRFEAGRACGVEIDANGTSGFVRAGHVFLCAGALQTPAILLRSGVGDARALDGMGIPVVAHRPGVGRNLQNHCAVPLGVALRGRTPLGTHLPTAHAALRVSSGSHGSGGDIYLSVWDRAAWHAAGGHIAVLNVVLHRPLSSGAVRLRSSDPRLPPLVHFNMLEHPSDVERLATAVRMAVGFLQTSHVRQISHEVGLLRLGPAATWMGLRTSATRAVSTVLGQVARLSPGLLRPLHRLALHALPPPLLTAEASAAQHAALRSAIVLQYHQVGTCAMGPADAPDSVTSASGHVHGVQGLSVADASVLPAVPRANTNLPVMMAAEKISTMFLEQRANPHQCLSREETVC